MLKILRRVLIGKPMESARIAHERLTTLKGLAILSSDALSSVAYAGEEILRVLIPVIAVASFSLITPISAAIVILLFIVSFSYRQIIDAFPKSSGGAYIVAKEHLGVNTGLVAGAALLFDYLLTVSVSVSAGVAAFTSAYRPAAQYKVALCLVVVAILVVLNLRGITESATVFSYPTYAFIIGMFLLIGIGFYKIFIVHIPITNLPPPQPANPDISSLALTWLILRAFSSGCAALTGVEAVSNAVPNFKEPENKNAKMVLALLAFLLFVMFSGLTFLTKALYIGPVHEMTVISQVAHKVFGQGVSFYLFQASTFLILALAANTAFAGFPMLASLMARDGFLPRYLALRGDRLVFSNGIVMLGVLAGILLTIFDGITTRLIPLYAVGVFTSFTLSQSGMVRRWLTHKTGNWRTKLFINSLGAIVTGTVTVVIAVTKFKHGAWVILVLVPVMVYSFRAVHKHYMDVKSQLDFDNYLKRPGLMHKIIIPAASLTNVVANTVDYAKEISDDVKAVHISSDKEFTEKFRRKWETWNPGIELVVIDSPYRSVFDPLVEYIIEADKNKAEGEVVTVLIPEFVTCRWWQRFLHNQTGLMLQNLLVFQTDVVVTTVPFHLKECEI
ncbi:MAG: amino acid permease [Firmicutes bacterium HGW-Firmicutes-8]|nr:MAG: amino acid permease [Firmicutes bacterium HGW-Firmicutes-8]